MVCHRFFVSIFASVISVRDWSSVCRHSSYLDDIIIVGVDRIDLEKKLDQVLSWIAEYALRLPSQKCNFCMQKVRYLEFIVDKDDRQPLLENTQAVKTMPRPTNIPTLWSFLELVVHYRAFTHNLHRLGATLNNLLAKNPKWDCSADYQAAFDETRKIVVSNLRKNTLNYYGIIISYMNKVWDVQCKSRLAGINNWIGDISVYLEGILCFFSP